MHPDERVKEKITSPSSLLCSFFSFFFSRRRDDARRRFHGRLTSPQLSALRPRRSEPAVIIFPPQKAPPDRPHAMASPPSRPMVRCLSLLVFCFHCSQGEGPRWKRLTPTRATFWRNLIIQLTDVLRCVTMGLLHWLDRPLQLHKCTQRFVRMDTFRVLCVDVSESSSGPFRLCSLSLWISTFGCNYKYCHKTLPSVTRSSKPMVLVCRLNDNHYPPPFIAIVPGNKVTPNHTLVCQALITDG